MKKAMLLLSVLLSLLMLVSACTPPATEAGLEPLPLPEPLPPPEPDGGPFGVDVNYNINTIDDHLGRPDVAYIDMRMLYDPADFESIGGISRLTRTLPGYRIVPLPYIATLSAMPVAGAYEGDKLFEITWGDNGDILACVPNYAESEAILSNLFPKDKAIFLMCGGGGYSGLTKSFLIYMGWDENMIYNTGGNWYYEGNSSLDLTLPGDESVITTWVANYSFIDFGNLTRIS